MVSTAARAKETDRLNSLRERIRAAELQADLDYFIDGKRMNLRPLMSVEEYAQMALLEPPHAEVWEIRSVDPKPAIRIFGRMP